MLMIILLLLLLVVMNLLLQTRFVVAVYSNAVHSIAVVADFVDDDFSCLITMLLQLILLQCTILV